MENSLDAKVWHKIDYKGKIVIVAGSEGRGIKKIILDNFNKRLFRSTKSILK